MEILNTILYFLIVIVILVFVHELGHFLAAKFCKMRVDKFYLFFDFFNLKLFKFVKGDTEYGIGVFPLGGYVKVAGMIDESMDKEFLSNPPEPWEFRSKPVIQRMFVITAGVIMNLLLAVIIFYIIALAKGENYIDTNVVGYVSKYSVAEKFGIQPNDKILSINKNKINHWEEIFTNIYIEKLGENLEINLDRNGKNIVVSIPKGEVKDINNQKFGIYPPDFEPKINLVIDNKPAAKLGLQKEDVVTEFNGIPIKHSQQLVDLIRENAGKDVALVWIRNNVKMSGVVKPDVDSTIGVSVGNYSGAIKEVHYNAITAIPQAFFKLYHYGVELFIKSIYKIIKGDIPFSKAVGGPIKIAQIAGQSAESGFLSFLGFMAMLSVTLAIINILPFPALDGGHFVFLVYEAIFRKPVSHKIQIVVQNVGFIILMIFMALVVYNDILHI
jgi:regulator of sigma E protease